MRLITHTVSTRRYRTARLHKGVFSNYWRLETYRLRFTLLMAVIPIWFTRTDWRRHGTRLHAMYPRTW